MAAKLQTLRQGGAEHPETIVNFLDGAIVSSSGVVDKNSDHFKVAQQSVPNMTVQVALGKALLLKSDKSMCYPALLSGDPASVTIDPNASGNSRIDALVLYIDLAASANTDISNIAKLTKVNGTPAGSPAAPSDADISTAIGASNPFIRLANITVASGATSIQTANIADTRVDARFTQEVNVQKNLFNYAEDGGSNDTYVITLLPAPAAYVAGMKIAFKANTANTLACTLNVNGLGAKALKILKDQDPPSKYIKAGSIVQCIYDGTNFQILNVSALEGAKTLISNTDGATITFNLDSGNVHLVTLGGNRTLALSGGALGQVFMLRLKQDATGSRLVSAWFSGISWANGAAPSLTSTANKADTFGFIVTGVDGSGVPNAFDGYIVGQGL